MAPMQQHSPKAKNSHMLLPSLTYLNTTLLFFITLSIPALLLLHHHSPPTSALCKPSSFSSKWVPGGPSSGDLRQVEFAWNRLTFEPQSSSVPPPTSLKIAVFSRKWPSTSSPGGMERHALTLHSALARRGHRVHVFTSSAPPHNNNTNITLHVSKKKNWDYHEAWSAFRSENVSSPFDVVHSESVALPHSLARSLPNLAVSWHGVALEALHSKIYQALITPDAPPPQDHHDPDVVQKIVTEIRFFRSYSHHVAISESAGEMLRDVYQIPRTRVHVILNGVDDAADAFGVDPILGREFRARHGVPENATLVMGVSGRLVKDKGHPLLHEAFSKLGTAGIYLLVAGTGPWEQRYRELGPEVVAVGALRAEELRGFYNALDVFVNPTLRPQGLDLTLVEAMMCGKPVVATGFRSIKGSVIVDPEFGHAFAPNVEALMEALKLVVEEGKERLEERGRACRKYASAMFAAPKMALAYERLFLCIKNEEFCRYPFPS